MQKKLYLNSKSPAMGKKVRFYMYNNVEVKYIIGLIHTAIISAHQISYMKG